MKKFLVVGLVAGILAVSAPAQAHHASSLRKAKQRIAALENKVNMLTQKTQNLDIDGWYLALAEDWQVISYDFCLPGDDAVWDDTGVADLSYLSCSEGAYGQQSVSQRYGGMLDDFRAAKLGTR